MELPFGKADITLAIMLVVVLGAVWMSGSFSGTDYTPSDFCKRTAVAAEGNLSRGYTGVSCRCESPERYMRSINATTPGPVMNVTDVDDILVCETDQFEDDMVFPLLQINETKYNRSGGLNGSLNRSMLTGRQPFARS